jgi:hypothetical protein
MNEQDKRHLEMAHHVSSNGPVSGNPVRIEGELSQSSGSFGAAVSLIVSFAMIGSLGFIPPGISVWVADGTHQARS